MEKDQNTSSETQNSEAEEIKVEKLNNDTQPDALEDKEQTNKFFSVSRINRKCF